MQLRQLVLISIDYQVKLVMHNNHPEIVLGFDFGLKKIGVAVGQCITQSANPLNILKAQNGTPQWDLIAALIAEWGAEALIIGLPLNMDGSEQPITKRAKRFANQLHGRFKLPIFLVDERLTTIAAKDHMHTTIEGRGRFGLADSISAKLIVESWLRSQ